jgi:hypothetical protein
MGLLCVDSLRGAVGRRSAAHNQFDVESPGHDRSDGGL